MQQMDMKQHGDALAYTAVTLPSISETIGTAPMHDWMFYVHTPHDGKTFIVIHENTYLRLLALTLELRGLPHRAQWRAHSDARSTYRRVLPVTPTLVDAVSKASSNRPCFMAALRFINRCTHLQPRHVTNLRITSSVVATPWMATLWTRLLPPAITAVMTELGDVAAAQVRSYYAAPRRPCPWTSAPNVLDALRIATEAAGTNTVMHVSWVTLTLLRSWLSKNSDINTSALRAAITPCMVTEADTFESMLSTDPSTHYQCVNRFRGERLSPDGHPLHEVASIQLPDTALYSAVLEFVGTPWSATTKRVRSSHVPPDKKVDGC